MKKYPFSPAILDALPEELAELFRGLEDTLLDEICSRLALKDQLNDLMRSQRIWQNCSGRLNLCC